ncbi:hypothetical protein ACWKSP_22075 [Micromonosporaceae bacterium Da 78-11]
MDDEEPRQRFAQAVRAAREPKTRYRQLEPFKPERKRGRPRKIS